MLKNFVEQTRAYSKAKVSYKDVENLLRFHFDILTICNYHCEYCYRRAEPGWGKILDLQKISAIIKDIDLLDKPFEVVYLGGEPTLHPNFEKILSLTYETKNLYSFAIITNLKTLKPNHLKLYEKMNNKLIVNVTFHPSQCNIEMFKKNLLELSKAVSVSVNVMLVSPNYKNEIFDIAEFMIKNNIPFTDNVPFEPLGASRFKNYSESYKNFLKDYTNNFKLFKNLIFKFKNRTEYLSDAECFLKGYNSLKGVCCENNNFQISIDGDISQMCTDRRLKIEELANFNCVVKCPKENCVCQGLLSKRKYV